MDFGDPRGAILATFEIIGTVALWVHIAAVLSVVMRNQYAKGTRGRYIFATLYRPLALGGPILWMCNLITDSLDESKPDWYAALDVLLVAITIWQYYSFRSDDDDFWTGLGGRLKRRVAAALRPRRLALNHAPQH